jgi:midasin (ATPase involved in ribosome maturation)
MNRLSNDRNIIVPNITKFIQLNINLMQALKQGNIFLTTDSNIASDVLLERSETNAGRLNVVSIYAC